jgi:hypothetical protein
VTTKQKRRCRKRERWRLRFWKRRIRARQPAVIAYINSLNLNPFPKTVAVRNEENP